MPTGGDFIDSNVILYLLDDGPKARRAEEILAHGGVISVQVLNEVLVNCVRNAGMGLCMDAFFFAREFELGGVISVQSCIRPVCADTFPLALMESAVRYPIGSESCNARPHSRD